MQTFWAAFFLSLASEMGDKSQLVALGFSTRFRLRHILIGMVWSIALVQGLSVGVGRLVANFIPMWSMHALAAVLFLVFACRSASQGDEESKEKGWKIHPILLVGVTLFLTEFGDKTMLATAALAGTSPWLPVWLGATAGMWTADALTVLAGKAVGEKIPPRVMRGVGTILFLGFGLWNVYLAFRTF